ncbi:MAG: ROK family protein [Paracoccaceae bacterium]
MHGRQQRIAGTNAERTKAYNRRVVLAYLLRHDRAGRAEIAKASRLSTQTVSNLITELASEGLVVSGGRRPSARGQPPVIYSVNPGGAVAFGFEVRPDALYMVQTDLAGRVLDAVQQPLTLCDPSQVLDRMAEMIAISSTASVQTRVLGVGLVMPGPFGVEGLSSAGETVLPLWDDIDVIARATARLGLPVVLEKDATAAAIAEGISGVAQGLTNFCFLYFGSGLGLGVIAGSQPLRGSFGNAGEIGHVVIRPGGLLCDCHNRGCLEQYVSRMALARHLAAQGWLPDDGPVGPDVVDRVATRLLSQADSGLLGWLEQAADALSQAVGLLENLFDPQTVILGGGLPDALLTALCARIDLPQGSVARHRGRTLPRVQRGASGRLTAAIGAAALVIHDAVTPRLDGPPTSAIGRLALPGDEAALI